MNSQEYLAQRVEDQINWMEAKCKWNQSRYKTLKVIEIVAAAMIPLLVSFKVDNVIFQNVLSVSVGLLGVLIVILTSIRQLYKYQENWITYRATLESMKREKFLYEAGAPPYDEASAFQKFVINIESLLAKENESWKAIWAQKDPEMKTPPTAPPNPESMNTPPAEVAKPEPSSNEAGGGKVEEFPPLDAGEDYKMPSADKKNEGDPAGV